MSTILVGFERRVGSFPSEKTGELISYSNRILKCITDDGANNDNIGFSPFEEKIKMSDIAEYLKVNKTDDAVDYALRNLVNKPVEFLRAPRNNEFVVVGFKAVKSGHDG